MDWFRENLIQFCGNFSGQVIFNQDTLVSSGLTDVNTGFAIFDPKGSEIGAQGIGGTGTDVGQAIAFTSLGGTNIAGYFTSSSLVIDDSVYSNISGNEDGFIASFLYPLNAVFTSIKPLGCAGNSNGELIVTPYFGVGPYTYSWSTNVTNNNDSLAFNLGEGSYSVTVTDSRDSVATTSITLTEPPALVLNAIQSDVSCYPGDGTSNDGSVDISVSGGTGSYSYTWQAISGSGVNATAQDQTTLTVGVYAVNVTDDNLCTVSDTFDIFQPAKIAFGESLITPETIPPGGDGAIDLELTGGNPSFDYLWSGPSGYTSADEDINNLHGGSYTVVVTDTKSCTGDTSFIVVNDTMLIAYISDKTDVDCNGESTGSASVSLINGTGPYTYHWENNLGNTVNGDNPTVTSLPADIYYVTVTDNYNGKTAAASVQIVEPSAGLTTGITIGSEIVCFGDANGVADLTVSGGTLPYSFSWSNGETEEDLINIEAGTYTVTVTDQNGCPADDQVTLSAPEAMDLIITIEQPIMCNGDATGRLTALATGGTGSKTYIWDDPGNQTAATATSLLAGIYHVTATDINLCTISGQAELIEPGVLVLSEIHTDVSCNGEDDGIINLTVTGGTSPYNYGWSGGQISQDIADLAPGNYSVTVDDAHACRAISSEISIAEPDELEIISHSVSGNTITVTAGGGTPPYTYTLEGLDESTTGVFSGLPNGTYTVEVTDDNNCGPVTITDLVVLTSLENYDERSIKVYPNPSDGMFNLTPGDFLTGELRLQVYSTTGELIRDEVLSDKADGNYILDLTGVEQGIYLMMINGISIETKLIIQ